MAGSGMPLNVSREAGLKQVAMLVRSIYHNSLECLNNMKLVPLNVSCLLGLGRQIQFLLWTHLEGSGTREKVLFARAFGPSTFPTSFVIHNCNDMTAAFIHFKWPGIKFC